MSKCTARMRVRDARRDVITCYFYINYMIINAIKGINYPKYMHVIIF